MNIRHAADNESLVIVSLEVYMRILTEYARIILCIYKAVD